MNNYVLIIEAAKHVPYAKEHISWLLREGKVKGYKTGMVWFVDLEDLKEYHSKMEELGSHRHNPKQ